MRQGGDYSIEPGTGGGTGPHLHFQWNNKDAAARFAKVFGPAPVAALAPYHDAIDRMQAPYHDAIDRAVARKTAAVDRAIGSQSFLHGGGMGVNHHGVVNINLRGNLRDVNATTKIAGTLFKDVRLNRGAAYPTAEG